MQSYPQSPPLTLFIDTTQATQTLALWRGDGEVLAIHTDTDKRASNRLHSTLADLLAQQGLTLADVQRLVLTVGPGSFTGIRVGLAVAQALKLATNADIRTLSTFDALSLSSALTTPHTVVIDSLGQEVFAQSYTTAGITAGEATCVPKEGFVAHSPLITNDAFQFPQAAATTLDINTLCAQAHTLSTDLQPLYLKGLNFRKIGA